MVLYLLKFIPISIFSIMEQSILLIISIVVGRIFLKKVVDGKTWIAICFMLIGLFFVVTNGVFSMQGVQIEGVIILI